MIHDIRLKSLDGNQSHFYKLSEVNERSRKVEASWITCSSVSLSGEELAIQLRGPYRKDLKMGSEKLICVREFGETTSQAIRYSSIIYALRLLIFTLQSPGRTTLRDIYYREVIGFNGNQENLNWALRSICHSLNLSMTGDLLIMPSSRGIIWGGPRIQMRFSNDFFLELSYSSDLSMVPNFKALESIDLSKVDAIIILEKEAIFRSFSDFLKSTELSTILISGRGFPDHATRSAVRILEQKLPKTPILTFVDSDVYGLRIFWNYLFTLEGKTRNVKLVGAFLLEHEGEFLTITKREWKLLMSFLKEINHSDDCYNLKVVRRELTRGMLLAKKAEINAICNPMVVDDLNNYMLRKVLAFLNR